MTNRRNLSSRRQFLSRSVAGALAASAGLARVDGFGLGACPTQVPTTRTITPATNSATTGPVTGFALEIDRTIAVFPASLEGGNFTADVLAGTPGADGTSHKRLTNIRPEEISLTFGTAASKALLDWIKSSLEKHAVAKNGAIVFLGNGMRPVSRIEWSNALISEVSFPVCNASSKDELLIALKILPTQIRTAAAVLSSTSGVIPSKPWQSSNFALQILGCENSCRAVNSIDAVTVKFPAASAAIGATRDYAKLSGAMDVSNLSVVLDFAKAGDFQRWQQSFEVQGQNSLEKSGTLQYLGADLRTPLFSLNFAGLGIYKLSPISVGGFERVKVQMFCYSVDLA